MTKTVQSVSIGKHVEKFRTPGGEKKNKPSAVEEPVIWNVALGILLYFNGALNELAICVRRSIFLHPVVHGPRYFGIFWTLSEQDGSMETRQFLKSQVGFLIIFLDFWEKFWISNNFSFSQKMKTKIVGKRASSSRQEGRWCVELSSWMTAVETEDVAYSDVRTRIQSQ